MAVSFKIIGRHIRAARKRRNLTQEQMAEAMDISVAHYGRLERGEREINMERLAEISVRLGVPIEKLVGGCVPDVSALPEDENNESQFIGQMKRYLQEGADRDAGGRGTYCRPACGRQRQRSAQRSGLLLPVQ